MMPVGQQCPHPLSQHCEAQQRLLLWPDRQHLPELQKVVMLRWLEWAIQSKVTLRFSVN